MGAWSGPFAIVAVLLAAGGVAKAVDPVTTVGALRGLGLRVPGALVRVGGAFEAVLAGIALVAGAWIAALLVGASYLAFAGFVGFALVRKAPIGSCGCFGRVDTPPTPFHVAFNLFAAAVSFVVAARDAGGVGSVLADQPLAGVPFVALVLVGAAAAYLVLTRLPQLSAVVRR
jgi:hypothetical protein